MTSTPPAGWYPDPENEGASRWWDGTQWGPAQEQAPPTQNAYDFGEYAPSSPAQDTTDPYGSFQGGGGPWTGPDGSQAPPGAGGPEQGEAAYGAYGSYGSYGSYASPWTQSSQKSRVGLFIGLGAGALAIIVGLIVVGVTVFGGDGGDDPTADPTGDPSGPASPPSSYPVTFALEVPAGGEARQDFVIENEGTYEISVNETNGEDPRASLEGPNGEIASDDDGGDHLNSLITESLEPGTFTLVVTEFGGDELTVEVTIEETDSGSAAPTDSPSASEEPSDDPPAEVVEEFQVEVPEGDGEEATREIVIETGGVYVISVENTNDSDPVLELESEDGETWEDDDGGDGLDPLLEEPLTPGTYTLTVTEFGGDELTADVTVSRR